MSLMAEARFKQTFDIADRTRRALASFAGSENLTIGQAIDRLVEQQLPEFLAIADRAIAKGEPAEKSKPGRRSKPRPG